MPTSLAPLRRNIESGDRTRPGFTGADLKNLKSVLMTVKRGRVYGRSAFVPLVMDDITDR